MNASCLSHKRLSIQDLVEAVPISHRTCIQCGTHIRYPEGTNETYIVVLLDDHLKSCSRELSTPASPGIASQHSIEDSVTISSENAPTLVGGSCSVSPTFTPIFLAQETFALEASQKRPAYSIKNANFTKKKEMSEDQRRLNLESDPYTRDVRPTSVLCIPCDKTISLDKRYRYYPYPWGKHRKKCQNIKAAEKKRLRGVSESPPTEDSLSLAAICSDSTDSVEQKSHAKRPCTAPLRSLGRVATKRLKESHE